MRVTVVVWYWDEKMSGLLDASRIPFKAPEIRVFQEGSELIGSLLATLAKAGMTACVSTEIVNEVTDAATPDPVDGQPGPTGTRVRRRVHRR